MRRELNKHNKGGEGVEYTTLCDKLSLTEEELQATVSELQSTQLALGEVGEKNKCVVLEVEELKAEVTYLHTKLKRQNSTGTGDAMSVSSTSSVVGARESYLRVDSLPFASTETFSPPRLPPHSLGPDLSTRTIT